MFHSFTEGASRRDVLRATAVGVGASMGLVGTASADSHVVEFDESLTITPDDSGKTFVQTADFEGRVRIEPGVEDVTVDGNGYTITGGGVGGGDTWEREISDVTLQNLHLPDGSFHFTETYDVVIRNNVARWVEFEHCIGVRFVDNTIEGLVQSVDNFGGSMITRNVAGGILFWEDVLGSHRVSNNYVTGHEGQNGILLAIENDYPGRVRYHDNYVANAGHDGISIDEAGDLNVEVHRNVVVGSGNHGLGTYGTVVESVRENVFVGNGGDGVRGIVDTCRNNLAAANDGDGFDIGVRGECVRNAAISNGGAGFRLGTGDVRVASNRSTGNGGDGVVVERARRTAFRDNQVTANGGDGLVLNDAQNCGVANNRVCGNDGEELVVGDDAADNAIEDNLVC